MIYNAIKIIVPIALIFIGMFDMAKAITTKSQEEVKKAQQLLVKKAIAGALVFVLFTAIAWILSIIDSTNGGNEGESVLKCMSALFDYKEATTGTQSGSSSGYTHPGSVCVTNGYDGVLKLYDDSGSSYYYMCYKYDQYDSRCASTDSGEKYLLADGNNYCVSVVNDNLAVILGADKPNTCGTQSSQEACQICCSGRGYVTGYLLSDDSQCLCVKKR
jgi:hypothetical protein